MNLYNLFDIWRKLNPETIRFTWRNKSLKIQYRLDFFLISNDLGDLATSCKILNVPETDHSAISLHLKSHELKQDKGTGFWKFNNSLLEDSRYVNKLRENIREYREKYANVEDLGLKWDLIKMEIRGFTIKYSKIKMKKREREELLLQKKANKLLHDSEKNHCDKKILNELYVTNLRLKEIMHQRTKGAILRSKARWHEHGERNTRYFFNLEKRNHTRKTVTKLKIGDNKPTNENKILDYGFTKENIHDVYLLPFSVTKETKLIAFQYKIIHNILPCRSSLFQAGLVDDDICPFCKLEKQTLVHMLYNCSESLHFWEKFTQWWEEIFFETIFLSTDVILFGWHQKPNNKRVLNYILIIAKYHIFTTSVCDDRLSFDCFLLRLKSKLDILRTIAIKNKSLNKFETTWAPFL